MAMTRDDVIRMAREAGVVDLSPYYTIPWGGQAAALERFSDLVAAAEREACAKACEDYEEHIETLRDGEYQAELAGRQAGAARCAVAIHARGGE